MARCKHPEATLLGLSPVYDFWGQTVIDWRLNVYCRDCQRGWMGRWVPYRRNSRYNNWVKPPQWARNIVLHYYPKIEETISQGARN